MLNPRLDYSKNGKDLTKGFESCRLTSYRDVRGIPTVGWGHTGAEVCDGMTITQAQADLFLDNDLQRSISTVNNHVEVPLNQCQFDALVDFVFNCGSGAFIGSTLLKKLNAGDYAGAADEFERWDKAAGVVVAGLLRRRKAEEAEFNGA